MTQVPDDPIAKLHKYVRAALKSAGKAVVSAPNGSRNDVLNKETYALAGFVPKYLDRDLLREVMLAAILSNGGDENKDGRKIDDAIEAGMKKPRELPEKPRKAPSRSVASPTSPEGEGQSAIAGVFLVGDQTEMALALLTTLQASGPELVHDEGALYRFTPDTKTWEAVDEGEQSRIVQRFSGMPIEDGNKLVKVQASDVSGARKLAGHRVKRDGFFAEGAAGIAFSNGFAVVTADGVNLQPLTPDNRARHAYPFAFDKKAHPTRFLQFLNDVWRDDHDKQQKIMLIQEFAGLSLIGRATSFERCIVTVGKTVPRPGEENGSNGKTTLGKTLKRIFRSELVTHIPPQLFSDEYRRAQLAGKRLNIVGELPEADIMDSEAFKAIITGDAINARPIYAAPFDLVPQAGHLFSCNTLPGSNDLTYAFFRRFILLTFNRTFRPGDGTHVPDLDLRIAEAETEQIVSWLLEGAVRALAQGHYTIPASHEEELAEWKRTANQVALFIDEQCLPAKSLRPVVDGRAHDWTKASTLYSAYTLWCHETGHKAMASNKFSSRLKQAGHTPTKIENGAYYSLTLRNVLALGDPAGLRAREAEIELQRRGRDAEGRRSCTYHS